MKTNKYKILSALFLFVFLSAFSSGLYISLSNSLPNLAHFSKAKEIKRNSNSNTEEFVYEENETESENELNLEHFVFSLPFFVTCFNAEISVNLFVVDKPIIQKPDTPIYLSVCNFRI